MEKKISISISAEMIKKIVHEGTLRPAHNNYRGVRKKPFINYVFRQDFFYYIYIM